MELSEFATNYTASWQRFVSDLQRVFGHLSEHIKTSSNANLHDVLRSLYGIPYSEVRKALQVPRVDDTPENIGPVTGLFFEQAVIAVVVPFIRRYLPNARFERNKCSGPRVRALARDPDLYVRNENREAVFELKVSPKKRDLEYVMELRQKYVAADIGYYLIGGYVAASPPLLGQFKNECWACFIDCSPSNQQLLSELPTLDSVVDSAVKWLSGT